MREHTHTRNRVRKKAHFFRMFSMIAFIISWMALEPLGGQFLLANSYSLFWLFVHFASYILMGFTVYLQAKALSYDYTKVDFKLLWGTNQPSAERRCLMLPTIPICIIVDIGALIFSPLH